MRGVWWSAFALLLLTVVTVASGLRSAQVEGTSRISRRPSSSDRTSASLNKTEDIPQIPRSRVARRREETSDIPRDISRTRSRSRPTEITGTSTEQTQSHSQRSDRSDSRRLHTRTRSKPAVNEETFDTTVNRDSQSRSRPRQTSRHVTSQTTQAPQSSSVSSLSRNQKDLSDAASNDISKISPKVVNEPSNQFRRRSSTTQVIETTTARIQARGRINTRTNIRALDLEVSGTANALTTALKEPTTARTEDLRNSRKLRYKTRQSEVDTNLTGEGLPTSNEVKSSQIRENNTSQPGLNSFSRSTTEKIIRQSTERVSKTSTIKTTKVIKRPVSRGKAKAPVFTAGDKPKVSDEIQEDDNYPETFKALIQAKNASTQASSPPSESLSVKASQKVIKTYTSSSQTIQTAPDTEKHYLLRSKNNVEEAMNGTKGNETQQIETIPLPEQPKAKSVEYRLRGSYTPRSKKPSLLSSSTISASSFSPATQRPYKFSRKLKSTTTQAPNVDNVIKTKRIESSNNKFKKPSIRSTLYSRRTTSKSFSVSTEVPKISDTDRSDKIPSFKSKQVLPRTSYYSRLKSNVQGRTVTTEGNIQDDNEELIVAEKKTENTVDLPIIYTNSNNSANLGNNKESKLTEVNQNFIITVNSKESAENGTNNEIVSNISEENEIKPINNILSTTQKYHATYKDNANEVSLHDREKITVTPSIRNIQTRKYGRKSLRRKEEASIATTKSSVRNLRKYSDTFSKTTEPSSNGIIADPEKVKNKFSSKYRASYLNKPFYKPTVPTITSSTAWLKFYVTDHLLSKSITEPNWFEDEDFSDVTTEQISRPNTTSSTCMHETAYLPVEGEEIQLGPDMNAISFTKSRSPLTSADLKLSESLAKSLQVMNVEASHHSPSVTVSIFDALAEILTSTTKPRISSTTEVLQSQNLNNDVKQTLDGVSSNINVNSVKDLTSQDTFMSTDIVTTIAKSVQTTESSTPNVFNSMQVEEIITPSQNREARTDSPVNTPQTATPPNPTPTTPVSARRPFAIKLLYTDTEPITDKTTAATSTNQPTTDTSTRVYNTVSDLILSNNKIVSSGLTSMLSNNIKEIIQNMDEESRARLSVDMVKLVNTLIPKLNRPISIQDDIDSSPNTTPYSLEDINDTANIDINDGTNIPSENILQNVETMSTVNSTKLNVETTTTPINTALNVNSTFSIERSNSILSAPGVQVTLPVELNNTNILSNSNNISSNIFKLSTNVASSTPGTDTIIVNNNMSLIENNVTNQSPPVPFLTNFELNDFTSNDSDNLNSMQLLPIAPTTSLQLKELDDIDDIQDPSQLSRLQLWILSKKARVLKMIEDIIRNHNDEIANAPLTELISNSSNNVSISSRLNDIVNTMSLTTTTATTSDVNDVNFNGLTSTETNTETTTPSPTFSFTSPQNLITTENSITTAQIIADVISTTTPTSLDASTISINIETTASQSAIDIADASSSTSTPNAESTTIDLINRSFDTVEVTTTSAEIIQSTISSNDEDATTVSNNESILDLSTTTENNIEFTTLADTETTTDASINKTVSENINDKSNNSIVSTISTIPKKDYVIFGILPNNTVVRKDPNDDVLETLTEASPYIIYGVLPNNTVIRKFPNGTRVPRIMQKIDILPISPWSLRNPYSPIHNIPAIVRPQSNPIRVSTNSVTSKDTSNNGSENQLTTDTVNNLQTTISSSALNIKDSSSLGITTSTFMPPAEKSTASHVLSLRTTTMLPSVDEILLNSISSATKEEMVISSMTSSTSEPRILTLDIDPETKQIRTEKPDNGNGNTVFKFIPIDEVTVSPQQSNVLRLASTKMPKTTQTEPSTQIQTEITSESTVLPSEQPILFNDISTESTSVPQASMTPTTEAITTIPSTATQMPSTTTIEPITNKATTTRPTSTTITTIPSTTIVTTIQSTTFIPTTMATQSTKNGFETAASNQKDADILQSLIREIGRSPKKLNILSNGNQVPSIQQNENAKLLQALLTGGTQNFINNKNIVQTTTVRSIEDDIRQFEEDTRLLKALLLATGQNPAQLNLPNLDAIKAATTSSSITTTALPIPTTVSSTTTAASTTSTTTTTTTTTTTPPPTTTTTRTTTIPPPPTTTTTTTPPPTTTTFSTTTSIRADMTTTSSLNDDLRKLQEDTKLLQALLLATGNQNIGNLPDISGITSNVRIASNPLTTSIESNPTTPANVRPVYTTRLSPVFTTITPGTVSTLQPQQLSTEDVRISTTFQPFIERSTSNAQGSQQSATTTRRPKAARFQFTTETPSTSTFSDEEDLLFLQNLKSVLSSKNGVEDPETALANRVIALAVERSLNEIQGGTSTTSRPSTTTRRTTTRPPTTTTARTTIAASTSNTPSLEEDIKQFEEDTKLLQALLKATGQDPSKFNIPTLNINKPDSDIKSSNTVTNPTTTKPFGAKIAVKDDLTNEQDDAKLLQTLIKLQDAQETTTIRGKIALTGQSSDEALKKLLQQAQPTGMLSEATKSSISLSTEYGNSNDALLAALLKEQGFGPTTASSIDEQLRLAALLNQVVVTPKARRTTTPPPPPAPRRPILDGLAWLWQQWRETDPGSGPSRPNRRPEPSAKPSATPSAATSSRVNWFGSGPFVGNADERPSSNRVPLEPPSAITSEQGPRSGQLVSAAINVTRAFSQFLGAAIQGAAQTVQSVIRAGQRAASDVYTNGSG